MAWCGVYIKESRGVCINGWRGVWCDVYMREWRDMWCSVYKEAITCCPNCSTIQIYETHCYCSVVMVYIFFTREKTRLYTFFCQVRQMKKLTEAVSSYFARCSYIEYDCNITVSL